MVAAAAAFILFLREGLEASLIVSILFASLRQLGQLRHMRAVWTGVALAIVASFVGGILIYSTVRAYTGTTFQTIFETCAYLLAVGLLTYMTFWMQSHSRTLKKELSAKAGVAGSGFAMGLLAFSTVGREGLESAVFTLAFAFTANSLLLISGALLGIAASVALCFMIYRLGYRLDYRIFFRAMGILLIIFAAGLLGDAVQNLQTLGVLPFGANALWDSSHILSQDTTIGDILHTFLGYSDAPTALQTALYALYLLSAGLIFWRVTAKPSAQVRPAVAQPPRPNARPVVRRPYTAR